MILLLSPIILLLAILISTLSVLAQVAEKVEELILLTQELWFETTVGQVVAAVIIGFEACFLLFLLVALLWWASKGLMAITMLVILLIQLTVETVGIRLSMIRPAELQAVKVEREPSRIRRP
jgi:hypothetical protein